MRKPLLVSLFHNNIYTTRLVLKLLFIIASLQQLHSIQGFVLSRRLFHKSPTNMLSQNDDSNRQEQHHLILVGGGHAHVQVILALNQSVRPVHLKVTLIDPLASTTYSGMIPGCIAGHYTAAETQIDLTALTQWAGIEFVQDRVVDIDLERQCVYLDKNKNDKQPLFYDAMSLDIGSTTRGWNSIPGARDYTIPTRPIHSLVRRLEEFHVQLDDTDDTPIQLVVVGGGAAGVELSMAVTTRWRHDVATRRVEGTLLDSGSQSSWMGFSENEPGRRLLQSVLAEQAIAVQHDAHVAQVTATHVILHNGMEIPYTCCIWAAGAEAHDLARNVGLACSEHGWITVHPTLQSTSHSAVFAAGDCASIQGLSNGRLSPPKAGVYAVRAGPVLTHNLIHYLEGRPSAEWIVYEPQDDFMKLLVCGNGKAVGFRFHNQLSFSGKWVFEMKDRIDRNFMNLFDVSKLPDQRLLKRGDYTTRQYDAVEEDDSVVLDPPEAAILLQRTDDQVDYEMAWNVLRVMARDESYRDEILKWVESSPSAVAVIES